MLRVENDGRVSSRRRWACCCSSNWGYTEEEEVVVVEEKEEKEKEEEGEEEELLLALVAGRHGRHPARLDLRVFLARPETPERVVARTSRASRENPVRRCPG